MDIQENAPLLGILGGLGPYASAYFYELITTHTKADRDQDHINIILSSRASTPDRTDFILGNSDESPLPIMIRDAKALEQFGATAIVIPCNTAHYFIHEVRCAVSVPVPSIITETVLYLKQSGYNKAAILATTGTLSSGSYQEELTRFGLEYMTPGKEGREVLMDIIYNDVKKGKIPSMEKLYRVADPLFAAGCDCAVLACTELSLLHRDMLIYAARTGTAPDTRFVDSMTVLAEASIRLMGHQSAYGT
ncbi:MAG: amino acid racemase [Clostridia bacterium]|nr:amino acid racemase [Clostridia bacterium]